MRLSQPPVVKVDSNNSIIESLQEDFSMNIVRSRKQSMIGDLESMSIKSSARFDSIPISERIWLQMPEKSLDVGIDLTKHINYAYSEASSSMRENQTILTNKNKQTMFSDEDSGGDNDKKALAIDDKKLLVENYQLSEPNFSVSNKNTSVVIEYKKLTDLSKKVRKTYNQVLYVDEKFDDIDENMKREGKNMNRSGQRSGPQKVIRQIAFPEDQKLFQEYCSFFKKNTDEMFNDEEMKHDLQEEMKVFPLFWIKISNLDKARV